MMHMYLTNHDVISQCMQRCLILGPAQLSVACSTESWAGPGNKVAECVYLLQFCHYKESSSRITANIFHLSPLPAGCPLSLLPSLFTHLCAECGGREGGVFVGGTVFVPSREERSSCHLKTRWQNRVRTN